MMTGYKLEANKLVKPTNKARNPFSYLRYYINRNLQIITLFVIQFEVNTQEFF